MASLILRRPAWCLELSRSAAAPSLAFSTSIRSFSSSTPNSTHHPQFPSSIRRFSTSPLRRANPTPPTIKDPIKPPPQTARTTTNPPTTPPGTIPARSPSATKPPITVLTSGLSDEPPVSLESDPSTDWTKSFKGLSDVPFSAEAATILMEKIPENDVEIKPDGILYLPEIKYRRILNRAFGPGGWGLAPRGESMVTQKAVTREYALVAHGRLVSIARGEQDYFSPEGIPTAAEGCKSNAMMRCCKDLGVASELWDPRWIREFKRKNTKEMFVEHVVSKKKTKIWIRKDDEVRFPWKESKPSFGA